MSGKIPADWFAKQVALADRTDGDLDTLSNRLAQIRTWTFVSHQAQWLDDPEHWQGRTKAIEDTLSDALHERLTQRFVDRRTSVLMRRLRDKEEIAADIAPDGHILVENHFVGRLDGFRFTPDSTGEDIHGRAARHAAAKVLAGELVDPRRGRLRRADEAIALNPNGRIVWAGRGHRPARARRDGAEAAHPAPRRRASFGAPSASASLQRLDAWLEAELGSKLKPLVALERGHRLIGAWPRSCLSIDRESRRLPPRSRCRRHQGARSGRARPASQIRRPLRRLQYLLSALCSSRPRPICVLILWALHSGRDHGIDLEDLPLRPQQGLTSVEAGSAMPEPYWRAAGFHVAGTRAVRIDMLERLSDLIRTRVAFRAAEGVEAPAGATGDGGFRVVPELMSVVGCSGEDFASILKSLGFRRERPPVPVRRSGAAPTANAARYRRPSPSMRSGVLASAEAQDKVEEPQAQAENARQGAKTRAAAQRPPRRAEAAERKKLEAFALRRPCRA